MSGLFLLATFAIQPVLAEPLRDRCASIELNHYYDDQGRPVFDQYIFRDADEIVAWRLVRPGFNVPIKRTHGGVWLLWNDVNNGPMRRVDALSFYETWSQYDPEVAEREWLPECQRRGLKKCNQ